MLPRFVSQLSLLVDSQRLPSSSKHWYTAPAVPLIRPHPYLLPLISQQIGVCCNGTLRCLSASRAWPANHCIHFDCHAFDLLRQVQGSQLESSSRELCLHQHSRGYRGVMLREAWYYCRDLVWKVNKIVRYAFDVTGGYWCYGQVSKIMHTACFARPPGCTLSGNPSVRGADCNANAQCHNALALHGLGSGR